MIAKIKEVIKYRRLSEKVFWPLIAFFCTAFFYFQRYLIFYTKWEDESETVVVAKLIANGKHLYSEIFDNHGPLTFLLGSLIELTGDYSVPAHRIIIVLLQGVVLILLFRNKNLVSRYARANASIAAGLSFVFLLPGDLGHTIQYDVIAGCLLSIATIVYIIPAITHPESLTRYAIAAGNLIIGSVAFLAITYWPALLLVFILAIRLRYARIAIIWLLISIGLNLAFLSLIGSIYGYYVDHVYFNLIVLSSYMGMSFQNSVLRLCDAVSEVWWLFAGLAFSAIVLSANTNKIAKLRFVIFILALLTFFIRGASFHAMPGIYVIVVLFAMSFGLLSEKTLRDGDSRTFIYFGTIALVFIFYRGPDYIKIISSDRFPQSSEFSQFARFVTDKQDPVISYTFNNTEYLLSDRLPASGNFFYLPWQEKYNQRPIMGIKIDACQQINATRPKLMYIDKWSAWNKYPWDAYAFCVQNILDTHYTQIPGRPFYIRTDLLEDPYSLNHNAYSIDSHSSNRLGDSSPIILSMIPPPQNQNAGLKAIGVMFRTYGKQPSGKAELRLRRPDSSELTLRFATSDLVDNKYRYFDLDSKHYIAGEILSGPSGGLGTWEAYDRSGAPHTCIVYKYTDGKLDFTPGCPPL